MARSHDPRSPLPSQRGPKRTGDIGGILPGDHVEVAREIARIRHDLTHVKGSGGGSAATSTRRLEALWNGTLPPLSVGFAGGVWSVPFIDGVGKTFALNRAKFRLEQPASSGSYAVTLEKSVSGGAFAPVTIVTLTLATGVREVITLVGLGTVDSGDLLRVNWAVLGSGGSTFTVQLEGVAS